MMMTRWAAAISVAAFLSLASAGSALAHATLISSDPADSTVLADAPKSLTLQFTEPVRPLVARLIRPSGHTDVLTDIGEKGNAVVLTLPEGLENGTYILSWRVASSDGHPIGGGLVFSVGAASAVAATPEPQSDTIVKAGLWVSRLFLLLGLVFGLGGTVFTVLIARLPETEGRSSELLLGAGLIGTVTLIGFQGLDALGEPVSSLLSGDVWRTGLTATSYGRSALIGATALLLGYAARQTRTRHRTSMTLALAALFCLGLSIVSAGHAATASPVSLTWPALFFHAITATLWFGALLPLWRLLAITSDRTIPSLRRFSASIPVILGVLLVTGVILAAVQLQNVSALWSTGYGLVLTTKLILVSLLLGLAVLNRYRLTTPVLSGDVFALRQLTRSIRAEVVIGTVIIAVLGLWRFTPPPRSMAAVTVLTQDIQAQNEGLSARFLLRPAVVGPVTVEIRDLLLDGKPVVPLSISVDLDKPSYGIGPFTRPAAKIGADHYRADGFVLPLDGFWVVRVTVLVSEFRSVTLTDIFDVGKATR